MKMGSDILTEFQRSAGTTTWAVRSRSVLGSLVKFNARFVAYMGHHNIRPHACNVAKGNEKGRVKDAIKYIRMNFFAGREFKNFEDLVMQSILWRDNTANRREHRSMKRIVRLVFESVEKPKLMARNPSIYETDEIFSRVVGPDFHFIYETNRYSVPWTLTQLIAAKIKTAKFRQEQTVDTFNFKHSRAVEKFEKAYLTLPAFGVGPRPLGRGI